MKTSRAILHLCIITLSIQSLPASGGEKLPVRFFGSGTSPIIRITEVDARIPRPDSLLGFPLGERPAHQTQVLAYFRALESVSNRIRVFPMGETYEGRPLVYAVISDSSNLSRLEAIKSELAAIADPRSTRTAEVPALVERTPACIWLAYSIHGDEISGVDASLAVAFHLVAGTDALTDSIRKNLVVIIDPIENPDGRERYLAQLESFSSAIPHADGQSLQKGGFWPWGRGNHYLFDMNRDWFTLELAESRARMNAVMGWHPQVLVDAHEMGQWDTYLFSPPRAPFNLFLTERIREWGRRFAVDQASAFDRRGWAYYTREWNEEMFPGYGSSWPHFTGAVGILYEQAGVTGRIARHDGTTMTYAETIEHHYVSSMANITTTLRNRRQLLTDYHDHRKNAVEHFGGGDVKAFLVAPDNNPDRMNTLADVLTRQGISVTVASEGFSASVRGYYAGEDSSHRFNAGTLIIATDQPQGYLIQTILGFDQRLPDSFLTVERHELLKNRDSKLYEVTSWSLLQAYGLDAYASTRSISTTATPWTPPVWEGGTSGADPLQGYLFDAGTDRGLRAVAMMMEQGLALQASRKALDVEGKSLPRGAVFVPARSNAPGYRRMVDSVARLTGIRAAGIYSGLGSTGPDLGGRELELLRAPRVALVAGGTTSFMSVGWIWHLLDQKLGVAVSLLDIGQVSGLDLSVYNVIILPEGNSFSGALGKGSAEHLKKWVESGGTLIAMGGAAGYCADSTNGISSVRIRGQALPKLVEYDQAAMEEIAAETPDITRLKIWDYPGPDTTTVKTETRPVSPEELKKEDELGRLFSPHGTILRVNLDQENWLTFGLGERVPVMVTSPTTLMARYPAARTVGRFAPAPSLRVSGLLWPEARVRVANTSFCTQESSGQGQIILFSAQPNFRAYFRGAERMLSNAILFGPGMGTQWTPKW
jgi:hypothetical protein